LQTDLADGLIHISMALLKNLWFLTGSRAVTNRHTSEAQSPAPGISRFEIGWVILEGQERSWGWVLGLFFLCSVVCLVSLLCVATCVYFLAL
jgi:hypothetical protein